MEQVTHSRKAGLCGSHALNNGKSVFLSGRIRGLSFDQVVNKFDNKANELRAQGFKVTNPVERIMQINFSRKRLGQEPLTDEEHLREIMAICLYDMLLCDELHMLPDWQESPGATLERDVALRMQVPIVYH